MKDDAAPTPAELAEAEALANALDARPGGSPPVEAVEAASLLRHDRRLAAFDAAARARVEARILGAASTSRRERRRLSWLVPTVALAAAGLAGIFLVQSAQAPAPSVPPSAWPAPPRALLDAQLAALESGTLAPLEQPMRGYRAELLRAMRERAGGGP